MPLNADFREGELTHSFRCERALSLLLPQVGVTQFLGNLAESSYGVTGEHHGSSPDSEAPSFPRLGLASGPG